MKNNETGESHGFESRNEFWAKEINGKTVGEVAQIIADFEERATRDKLTGLVNRDEFEKQFETVASGAERRDSDVYVCFFDFDDLKKTNDEKGHSAGNELLKNGTMLLKSALRSSDLLGRIGGDEFAAALEVTDGVLERESFVEDLTQRIVSNLAEGGVSISVGISKYNKEEGLVGALDRAEKNMKLDKTDRKAGRDFIKVNV